MERSGKRRSDDEEDEIGAGSPSNNKFLAFGSPQKVFKLDSRRAVTGPLQSNSLEMIRRSPRLRRRRNWRWVYRHGAESSGGEEKRKETDKHIAWQIYYSGSVKGTLNYCATLEMEVIQLTPFRHSWYGSLEWKNFCSAPSPDFSSFSDCRHESRPIRL